MFIRKHPFGLFAALLAGVAFVAQPTPRSAAQELQSIEETVQQALDQPMALPLEISRKPVRAAMLELEQATGLRIVFSHAAMLALPYGEQTELTIRIENATVRQALKQVLDGLGMQMSVDRPTGDVLVTPIPPIERLNRRMTLDEVNLIAALNTQPWEKVAANLRIEIQGDPASAGAARSAFDSALKSAAGATAGERIENAAVSAKLLWTVSGNGIALYSAATELDRRLDRRIAMASRRAPIDQVLIDAGMKSGVRIDFSPDALDALAAAPRLIDYMQRNTSLREMLPRICTSARLTWANEGDRIVISAAAPAPTVIANAAAADGGSAGRVVAIVRIPVGDDGTTVEFLIRDDELPPEMRELKTRKMPEIIQQIRLKLSE